MPSGGYSTSIDCPSYYWKSFGNEVAFWSKADWQMIFEYVSPQDVETLSKELKAAKLTDQANIF